VGFGGEARVESLRLEVPEVGGLFIIIIAMPLNENFCLKFVRTHNTVSDAKI